MDSCVQGKCHLSCEGITSSVGENFCSFRALLVEREGFRVLSTMGDLFTYGKLCTCPFLTPVRVPFWPRFFTKLNCFVPIGLGFLPFLIKAVTLFLLIVRLFKCPS